MNLFLKIMIFVGFGITSANTANSQELESEHALTLFGTAFIIFQPVFREINSSGGYSTSRRGDAVGFKEYGTPIVINKQKLADYITNEIESVTRVYNFEAISPHDEKLQLPIYYTHMPKRMAQVPQQIFEHPSRIPIQISIPTQMPTTTLIFTVDTTFDRTFSNIECDVEWWAESKQSAIEYFQSTHTFTVEHLIIKNCGNDEAVFRNSIALDINEIRPYPLSPDGHISLD